MKSTKKLPIITSAPHDSDNFGDFSNRVALDPWHIGEFSDRYTADTAFHPLALGNLKSILSRGLGNLNHPRDHSLFKLHDFHGNIIWKKDMHLKKHEKEKAFKNHHDPYYDEIKRLIKHSRKLGFKRVILWDHHDTGDYNPKTGKRDRKLPGENRSMPKFILSNFGLAHSGEINPKIGFNSSPALFIQNVQTLIAKEFKLKLHEVEINTSYKGGHITQYFGNPKSNLGNEVYAIQIEYNRGFIMDQETRKPFLERIREFNSKFNKAMENAVKILEIKY